MIEAPLYVRAHDLTRWLLERVLSWPAPAAATLGAPLTAAAQELVLAVSLAITFPAQRSSQLQRADHAVVGLRERMRLAVDLGLLSAGGHRYAAGELRDIGRMVGGWQLRLNRYVAKASHPETL